mgnify:CR=1 FL=1
MIYKEGVEMAGPRRSFRGVIFNLASQFFGNAPLENDSGGFLDGFMARKGGGVFGDVSHVDSKPDSPDKTGITELIGNYFSRARM